MDWTIVSVPGGAVRRQPDPHRHPRLSRGPRRRARRHLRRPVARADRRARRDDRAAACRSPAAIRMRPSVYWVSLAFTFIGAAIFSMIRGQAARASRRKRSSASATRWRRRPSILAMSKSTSRAEHLKDMLVGNILAVSWPEVWQDRRALRRDRRLPLHLPEAVPGDLDEPRAAPKRPASRRAVLGLPVLRVVRLRRHVARSRSPACCWCSAT